MVRRVLGRGLDALLPPVTTASISGGAALGEMIPINLVDLNPDQPRISLDPDALRELAQSVREKGIIQPLIVKKAGERYQLIAGERRLKACEMAGLNAVPAVIKDVADDEILVLALIENIQREDLNPLEEARAFEALIKQKGFTQEQLSSTIGKDRSTIANALRLLKLPEYILTAITEERLTSGHARALLMLEDNVSEMKALFNKIISRGLSVREAEAAVKKIKERIEKKVPAAPDGTEKNLFIRDAERRLCNKLSARVSIQQQKSGSGKIEIGFSSDEELQRIFELLLTVRY